MSDCGENMYQETDPAEARQQEIEDEYERSEEIVDAQWWDDELVRGKNAQGKAVTFRAN